MNFSEMFSTQPRPARKTGGSWLDRVAAQSLALVPLIVGLGLSALMLPRAVAPEGLPAPVVDGRRLAAAEALDDRRAVLARTTPLSSPVRAVGSGMRAFNRAEATGADDVTLTRARDEIIEGLRATTRADADGLLALRALQLESFLRETRAYERTGVVSTELSAVGGTFLDRMRKVGWVEQHRLAMPDAVRRVAFKLTWNHTALLDQDPRFGLSLDETRVLYGFYFAHPHASEEQRRVYEAAILRADTASARERATVAERRGVGAWVLGKVGELAKQDPEYPVELARGAALFLAHDYRASAATYEAWINDHPDGPWSLRAQNYLRAALTAAESNFE